MDFELRGRRAFVSGSTAGIGLAIARALAREGASVVVNGRTPERVAEAVVAVREIAPEADVQGIAADLSTPEGCAIVGKALPEVDVLVNNMGVFEPKSFVDISDADWLRFFETNVLSGVRLSRTYFPGMLARNWGRIIFVSSESALQIPVEMIHYGTTKTAQLAVARGLAEAARGTGVTVNSVLPGPTRSEGVGAFVEQLAKQSGKSSADVERDFFNTARPSSLIQRFATPDEIASLTVFVASAKAAAITGASLRVDGGVVRSIA